MTVNRFPVEGGHVLTFARAIGDTNAAYSDHRFDETGLIGVAVPPTFVQASAQFDTDYPLRPHPGKRWLTAQGSASDGANGCERGSAPEQNSGGTVLHAEQRYEFARPVRVGDVLSATARAGRSWEKARRNGGRLEFNETVTEYRDSDDQLVVTAIAVAVRVPSSDVEMEKAR
jgi:hypothetical protein